MRQPRYTYRKSADGNYVVLDNSIITMGPGNSDIGKIVSAHYTQREAEDAIGRYEAETARRGTPIEE